MRRLLRRRCVRRRSRVRQSQVCRSRVRQSRVRRSQVRRSQVRQSQVRQSQVRRSQVRRSQVLPISVCRSQVRQRTPTGNVQRAASAPRTGRKIRAYKLVTADLKSPIQREPDYLRDRFPPSVREADTNEARDCGPGINLATLPWCLNEHRKGIAFWCASSPRRT